MPSVQLLSTTAAELLANNNSAVSYCNFTLRPLEVENKGGDIFVDIKMFPFLFSQALLSQNENVTYYPVSSCYRLLLWVGATDVIHLFGAKTATVQGKSFHQVNYFVFYDNINYILIE